MIEDAEMALIICVHILAEVMMLKHNNCTNQVTLSDMIGNIQLRIDFEPFTGLWIIIDAAYYSYVRLYALRWEIVWTWSVR